MEFKGTKGKWKTSFKSNIHYIITANEKNFISLKTQDCTIEESEFNANLICASKEMFEFISEIAKRYSNSPWISNEANEILNKI